MKVISKLYLNLENFLSIEQGIHVLKWRQFVNPSKLLPSMSCTHTPCNGYILMYIYIYITYNAIKGIVYTYTIQRNIHPHKEPCMPYISTACTYDDPPAGEVDCSNGNSSSLKEKAFLDFFINSRSIMGKQLTLDTTRIMEDCFICIPFSFGGFADICSLTCFWNCFGSAISINKQDRTMLWYHYTRLLEFDHIKTVRNSSALFIAQCCINHCCRFNLLNILEFEAVISKNANRFLEKWKCFYL